MTGRAHRQDTDLALDVPLDGIRQIEASAGTGKTYTIAGLFVRLIVEKRLPVREILVMTFTRAATEELRRRLRERLALCARIAASEAFAAGEPAADEGEAEHRWSWTLLRRAVAGGEDPPSLARRLRAAALGMDEAAIYTIHGFCQRVLTEHAALLGSPAAGVQLVPGDRDLLEAFAADAWTRRAGAEDIEREALQALAATPDALAQALAGLVGFDGRIEPEPDAGEDPGAVDREACREAVLAGWRDGGEAAIAQFAAHLEAGHFKKTHYREDALVDLRDMARALAAGDWPGDAAVAHFAPARLQEALKVRAPAFPGHAAFDAIHALDAAMAADRQRLRGLQPRLLHALVGQARVWLAERKRELARLSYDDQISRVHAGLQVPGRGKALCAALRAQYPAALVDEFQDTDAHQFQIFARLYDGFGTLYCIGDPKQAIYGFRGGDVHAYLRARDLAGEPFRLARNFRSAPGLLDACQALFERRADVFIEDGIRFEAVAWGGRTPAGALQHQGADVAPMTLWQLPETPVAGGKQATRELLANACAGQIARLLAPGASQLGGDALQPGHVAVLVNTNDEATLVQRALGRRGVPAVCVQHESVYATAEALELRRLLDALLAPQDLALARAALATVLLGHTLAGLRAMHEDEATWRMALDELSDLRERWFGRGVMAMLERLGERHAARLLALADGERRLGNLLQLGDALQAESRRLASERAQRDWLARRMAEADSRNEDEQLRLESDAARVQIATVHASKGLEFDLVFLPFAALMQVREPKPGDFVRLHRGDTPVRRLILDTEQERDDAEAGAVAAARREDRAEGVRRLYVGVTRARHACWLSVGRVSSRDKGGVLDWVLGGDDTRGDALAAAGGAAVAAVPVPAAGDARLPRAATPELAPARRFTRAIDRDWWIHSFSRLAEGGRGEPLSGMDDDSPAPGQPPADAGEVEVPTQPRGTRFGQAVHDALEKVAFAEWADGFEAVPVAQRQVVRDALAAHGFGGDRGEGAWQATGRMLAAALGTPVLPGLALARLPEHARRAEMAFHFGIAGADTSRLLDLLHAHGYQRHRRDFARAGARLTGLMTGFIDLVFVHQGQWWIVDYKTNHLGTRLDDYAPQRLPAQVAHHDYDLQYLIYTVALHRWLRLMRGDGYDYARDIGGVLYLFLRGMGSGGEDNGIFRDRPPQALVEAMDALLAAPGEAA